MFVESFNYLKRGLKVLLISMLYFKFQQQQIIRMQFNSIFIIIIIIIIIVDR
jgi:hypothetical protein